MQKSGLAQSFEKINDLTGGTASQVAQGLMDAAETVTSDVVKAPLDALESLLGGGGGGKGKSEPTFDSGDQGVEAVAATAGDDPAAYQAAMQQKLEESKQKREKKLHQAREMIAQYDQQWKKTKQEDAERKQVDEMEAEQKDEQLKQLQVQKQQEAIALQDAKFKGGTGEMVKKTG